MSMAVKTARLAPSATTRVMNHSPFSFTFASKGPERTSAPGSVVPENVTSEFVTLSPSLWEVILIGGGVVSLGWVVVVVAVPWAVIVGSSGAAAGTCWMFVFGSMFVAACSSVSITRTASTADAIRADAGGAAARSVVGAPVSFAEVFGEGENAANPTTATSATIRRLAYVRGIRGLT